MADPTTLAQPGLINTAPGMTNTTPGTAADGATTGAPVTGYNAAQATAAPATTSSYDPKTYDVTPDMTVASQLKGIIASGSPLMQQAEANAKNVMNARGLINSTQAITAGQDAVINSALPIAQQDASTYGTMGAKTTDAANTALASEAAAKNTAGLQDAQLKTATSQYNAGQTNAALQTSSAASNAQSLQAQQNEANLKNIQANGQINTQITQLTNDNKTLLQTSQGAASIYTQALANLSAIITNNNLTADQKTTALNDGVQQLNDALSVLSTISGIPGIASTLDFTNPGSTAATTTPAATTSPRAPGILGALSGAPAATTAADTSGVPTASTATSSAPAPASGGQTPGVAAAMAAPARTGGGNSAIQDIHQALVAGIPVSAASWAKAGYGPNGAAL